MPASSHKRPFAVPLLAAAFGLAAGAALMWIWPPSRSVSEPYSSSTTPDAGGDRDDLTVSGTAMPGLIVARRAHAGSASDWLYSQEFSFRDWAGADADWETITLQIESTKTRQARVHRALFTGDFYAQIPIAKITSSGAELGVVLWPGNQIGNAHTGYHIRLKFDGWNEKNNVTDSPLGGEAVSLSLFRNGTRVAARELDLPKRPGRLLIRRAGDQILVGIDEQVLMVYRDRDPIETRHIGYYRSGLETADALAVADGEGIFEDHFDRSPAAWTAVGGHWEIAPRWICDRRWTFMTGGTYRNEAEKLAVLWSKHTFGSDVSVEFHAGIRMDVQRRVNGNYYVLGRDINVTICADGTDLTSGYTLTFGGLDGQLTGIYRKGKLVRQDSGTTMPRTMHIHNKWFRIRAERIGRRVRFRVQAYRAKADLIFDDPEPLTGRHVAIWTYDNGIVVARTRLSGLRTGPGVSPDDLTMKRPESFYDLLTPSAP